VLDTYAKGVTAMKALGTTSAQSWMHAANTHDMSPRSVPRNAFLAQCAHASTFFLPWHRAYLSWFESTVRAVTNTASWGLPYWDYSNPTSTKFRKVPPEFTVEKRTVNGQLIANSLFISGRGLTMPPDDTDVVTALADPMFVRPLPESGFGGVENFGSFGLIEDRPHNQIHMAIGALMSRTTTAAQDPIFWLHHSNIDRLWEVWRQLPGSMDLPTQPGVDPALVKAWKSAKYVFGNTAAKTTIRGSVLLDTNATALDYHYESTVLPASVASQVAAERAAIISGGPMGLAGQAWHMVAATDNQIDVGATGTTTNLRSDPRQLGLTAATPTGLVVQLSGVRATEPHDRYIVEAQVSAASPARQIGSITTFGLNGTPDTEERNYLVNAEQSVPTLVGDGWDGSELHVTIRPETDTEASGTGVTIRQIALHIRS
jgi:tyrosinase